MDQKEVAEMKERLEQLGFNDRQPYKPFYKKVMCAVGYHDWVKLYTITGNVMYEDGRMCDICTKMDEAH